MPFSFLILQSGVPVFCSCLINWKLRLWLCSLNYTYHRWNLKYWLSSANISEENHICLIFMKINWRHKSMYLAFIIILLFFLFYITISYVCHCIVFMSTLIKFHIYFFLILNVMINFVLNYPLPIHVNSNFCLVHLYQFCTTLLYLSLLQKRNRSPKMKHFNENEYRLCKLYAALWRQATVCLLQYPLQKIHQ